MLYSTQNELAEIVTDLSGESSLNRTKACVNSS